MAILLEALDDLEAVLITRAPRVHAGLRPGLADCEIDRLMRPLAPLVLPLDLRVLYRWHDGHDPRPGNGYLTLFYDENFSSLEKAVQQYGLWREVSDIWNPLWFPAFGDQHGAFVTMGQSPDDIAGPLWDYHSHDQDISGAYDSILALVCTTAAMWEEASEELDPQLSPSVRNEHNPLTIAPDGSRRRTLSRYGTRGWPTNWLKAAGVGPMEPENDEIVISVADFLALPKFDRPMRGTLHIRAGSGDWMYGRFADGTGSIEVLLLRERTENFREARGGMQAQVRLAALPEAPPPMSFTGDEIRQAIDPRIRDLYPQWVFDRLDEDFTADYLVERVIPL